MMEMKIISKKKFILNPDFKYVRIGEGPHRDYGISVVIEYAYNIRENRTQYINVDEFIKKMWN